MNTLQTCPYCGEPKPSAAGPDGKFFRCGRCDLIGRAERRKGIIRYYEKSYFDDYARDQLTGERNNIYEHILDRIETQSKAGRLLDVGCGCGFFLKSAGNRGWKFTGIDPSEKSICFARTLLGDAVFKATLDDFATQERFMAVTLINVLDHSPHPWDDLRRVHDLLEPGGLVFIRIPNGRLHFLLLRCLQYSGGGSLASRFLVFHEYSMTPRFIRRLLSDSGFKSIRVLNTDTK